MKALASILCLLLISGCMMQQPNQVVNPCAEKVDRLISIFENDFIELERSIGACLMTPVEDEIIDIVNNYMNCFIGVPNSIMFGAFPGEMREIHKVAGFDKSYMTYLAQCYEDTVSKGVFTFHVYSNDEFIDSLSIFAFHDFRNKTIKKDIDY
jgi:hypothetical protein|tara:strand:+ start:139 stop:597 length:459 start_codon:yes stop_codon:yes gene_type:complete